MPLRSPVGQLITCTMDGVTLLVQQFADTTDQQNLMVLVVAAVTPSLHGLELDKLLLPITQHLGLDQAQLTHLTDGEVAFGRNGRQSTVDAVHVSLRSIQHEKLCPHQPQRAKSSDFTPSLRQTERHPAPCL